MIVSAGHHSHSNMNNNNSDIAPSSGDAINLTNCMHINAHSVSIKILHQNIQSLRNKTLELEHLLLNLNIDVVCLCEHWLDEKIQKFCGLQPYKLAYSFCRKHFEHGGVSIYTRENYHTKPIHQINTLTQEMLIEIAAVYIHKLNMVILETYRIPTKLLQHMKVFLGVMQEALEIATTAYPQATIMVAGDFNLDLLEDSANSKNFKRLLATYGLQPTVLRPTRLNACLDIIFTNSFTHKADIISSNLSDHDAVMVEHEVKNYQPNPEAPNKKRIFSPENLNTFKTLLQNESWNNLDKENTASKKFTLFFDIYTSYCDLAFPFAKTKPFNNRNQLKPKRLKIVTREVEYAKSKLLFLYNCYKLNKNPVTKSLHKQQKIAYHNLLSEARKKENMSFINKAQNKAKATWKIINKELGKQTKEPNLMKVSPDEMNDYFINSVTTLVNNLPKSNISANEILRTHHTSNPGSFFVRATDNNEVVSIIRELKNKQCQDIYGMTIPLLKSVAEHIASPLATVINCCMEQGYFPDELKKAKIIPVFKKGDVADLSNYRPIAILPTISKVFEKILFNRLLEYINRNQILSQDQYGFKKDCSTTDAILALVNVITDAFENRDCVKSTFVDLSRAFDLVSHDIVLEKCEFYGLRGKIANILASYLQNRTQITNLNNKLSKEVKVGQGVPQGSILGPLLFLVYVNDFPSAVGAVSTVMFADDTTLTVIGQSTNNVNMLQSEVLNKCKVWLNANKLILNSAKTVSMHFSLAVPESECDQIKFLGVQLDNKLSWKKHVNVLCSRLSSTVFAIRKIMHVSSKETALETYYALFHSIISYGLLAWSSACENSLKEIFVLQKAAIRCITGRPRQDHCKPLFVELGILSLYSLIVYQKLCYVKMNLHKYNLHVHQHDYNTRNRHNLIVPHHRLTQSDRMLTGIRMFNTLPINVRNLNLKQFKNHIKKMLKLNCLYSQNEFYSICH